MSHPIEDIYTIQPIEGVLYEPYVRIPCTNSQVKSHPVTLYYGSNYTLPEGEWVVYVKETFHQWQRGQTWDNPKWHCIAVTNYGRFIRLQDISKDIQPFSSGQYWQYSPPDNSKIIKLEPLQYKLPTWFLQSFILHDIMYADPNTPNSISFPGPGHWGQAGTLTESLNSTTTTIQQINKEFHLFAAEKHKKNEEPAERQKKDELAIEAEVQRRIKEMKDEEMARELADLWHSSEDVKQHQRDRAAQAAEARYAAARNRGGRRRV